MQTIFNCGRCGSRNIMGQRYCIKCGERLVYSCHHCGFVGVDNTFLNCPQCSKPLDWPTGEPGKTRPVARPEPKVEVKVERPRKPVELQQIGGTSKEVPEGKKRSGCANFFLGPLIAMVILIIVFTFII